MTKHEKKGFAKTDVLANLIFEGIYSYDLSE